MSRAVVLLPYGPNMVPLRAWLGPEGGRDLVIVAPPAVAKLYEGWAARSVPFEPYNPCSALEAFVLRVAREERIDRIVAVAEGDLLRAAELRRVLGLPGQDVESARAFRDKVVMKALVTSAGIEVAEHAAVESACDVVRFVERFGYPVVAKPRCGTGSINTLIVRDSAALDAMFAALPEISGGLVESFVPGEMLHVDGLVHRGQHVLTSVSRYVTGCLAFYRGESLISVQLDTSDPLRSRLVAFAERVVAAMPLPELTPFHLEVFHTPDDRLVFCEVASRVSGGRVRESVAHTFGIDMTKTWIEWQLGLRDTVPTAKQPTTVCGDAAIPPRAGRITAFADALDVPGIVDLEVSCRPGDVLPPPATSTSSMATILAEAPTARELTERLARAVHQFETSCVFAEGR